MVQEIASHVIWHYDVPISECVDLTLPVGAIIFDLELFDNSIKLFVLCDEDAPPESRELLILSHGTYMPSVKVEYLGTVSLLDGNLIYHVFENLEPEQNSG